jgi:hypothetical protein
VHCLTVPAYITIAHYVGERSSVLQSPEVTVNPNLFTKRRPHVPPVLVTVTQQTLVSRQQLVCRGSIGLR